MARFDQDWDALGRNIQDIVDRAVSSQDYQKLNQNIRQAVDQAVDKGGQAVRRAVEKTGQVSQQGPRYRDRCRSAVPEKKKMPVLYRNTGGMLAGSIVKILGGSLLLGLSLLIFLSGMAVEAVFTGYGYQSFASVLSLAGCACGGVLVGSGAVRVNQIGRFKTYCKTLGEDTHCSLDRLARAVGKSVKFVRKELRFMIRKGFFLQGYLDQEESTLITSEQTYRHYRQSLLQYQQRKAMEEAARQKKPESGHTPEVQSVLEKGEAFLVQIRKCNEAIAGRVVSEKISRMELIVQRIFQRVDTAPEVVPELKKMMDYYLPMTVKLLRAYADMDAQPVQGETIQTSKEEIEKTLDTLNLAFEKLLDELFQDTAMDVSSDISVLQTLLAQEGLTEDDLSRLKKEKNL